MRTVIRVPMLFVVGLGVMSACKKSEQSAAVDTAKAVTDTMPAKSLYERLGGKAAITAVVDSFVGLVSGDARINKKFAKSDVGRVKTMLVDQICNQTGGPCTYTGRSMKEAHANMGVTEGEFNALVDDLITTLRAFNVPSKEQNELLTALGSMKGDIVEVQGQATGTPLPKKFVPVKAQ